MLHRHQLGGSERADVVRVGKGLGSSLDFNPLVDEKFLGESKHFCFWIKHWIVFIFNLLIFDCSEFVKCFCDALRELINFPNKSYFLLIPFRRILFSAPWWLKIHDKQQKFKHKAPSGEKNWFTLPTDLRSSHVNLISSKFNLLLKYQNKRWSLHRSAPSDCWSF